MVVTPLSPHPSQLILNLSRSQKASATIQREHSSILIVAAPYRPPKVPDRCHAKIEKSSAHKPVSEAHQMRQINSAPIGLKAFKFHVPHVGKLFIGPASWKLTLLSIKTAKQKPSHIHQIMVVGCNVSCPAK